MQGVLWVVASFIAELHGVDGERQIKHGVAWDSSLDSLEFCCPLYITAAERGGSQHQFNRCLSHGAERDEEVHVEQPDISSILPTSSVFPC